MGDIPYPVLSDFQPKGEVAKAYGVYNEERGTANRSVFLVDKRGIVRFKKLYSSMSQFGINEIVAEADKL